MVPLSAFYEFLSGSLNELPDLGWLYMTSQAKIERLWEILALDHGPPVKKSNKIALYISSAADRPTLLLHGGDHHGTMGATTLGLQWYIVSPNLFLEVVIMPHP